MAHSANKIYTKTGDHGSTSLLSGVRVSKSNAYIVANGAVDELNAWIGLLRDSTSDYEDQQMLLKIQGELMILGTQLASAQKPLPKYITPLGKEHIQHIESEIDRITETLHPLRNFILPGGHPLVSYAHIGRCVCRRAEQHLVELNRQQAVDEHILAYINRLSDYLFMLSRKFSKEKGAEEIKWKLS